MASIDTASTVTKSDTTCETAKHDLELIMKKRIAEWVRDTAFGCMKFLPKWEQYDKDSQFFKSCMDKCYPGYEKAEPEEEKILFTRYGKIARDKLATRRHNVVKTMKDKYKGKCF